MFVLRTFQDKIVNTAFDMLFNLNHTSALIQCPTGSGKTVITCELIKQIVEEVEKGRKILILVKQQTLLTQFHDALKKFGIDASVLHAEIKKGKDGKPFKLDWLNPVQITMPTTFLNTDNGDNDLYIDKNWKPDLLIIDEAHKGTSLEFQLIRDKFNPKVLGLTASPYREKNEEGEHLTEWYGDRLITGPSIKDLIDMGLLVQPEYVDFVSGAGDDKHMVNEWLALANGKQTIIFTTLTEESLIIKKAFNDSNISAEIITSGTEIIPGVTVTGQTPNQRQDIFDRFESGQIKVLISCGALCEGFDCPPAEVCILYRNISNHALFHQIIGRVLRAHISKTSALIIDFRDNIKKYGRVEDFIWNLDCELPSIQHLKQKENIDREDYKLRTAVYYTCHKCNHFYNIKKATTCVHCNEKAQIKITTTKFKEIQKIAPHVKDAMELRTFAIDFDTALTTTMNNPVIKFRRIQSFNSRTTQPIFNLQTGELFEQFKFLPDLLKRRISANEEYEVPVE